MLQFDNKHDVSIFVFELQTQVLRQRRKKEGSLKNKPSLEKLSSFFKFSYFFFKSWSIVDKCL